MSKVFIIVTKGATCEIVSKAYTSEEFATKLCKEMNDCVFGKVEPYKVISLELDDFKTANDLRKELEN